jgi:hypothetical protein
VLEAHLAVAPDLSFLALRGGSLFTSINTVDKNLILISSTFTESHYHEIFLIFYTVDSSKILYEIKERILINFDRMGLWSEYSHIHNKN